MASPLLNSGRVLLEREGELERLGGLLNQARAGDGRVVLVEGEAGIGKTTLLGELARSADAQGLRVLSGRGGELERDFAFGVTRQLFEPLLAALPAARRRRLFDGAAGLAAPMLGFGEANAAAPAVDPSFAINHGLYWLTANLADQGPLVLVVDDVHWVDPATLLFVNYLGRRLEGLRLLVVAGLRPAEPGSPRELLDALGELDGCERVRLERLSERASAKIVERALGEGMDDTFRSACHEATGGNPFLLEELLRSYAAEGGAGSAQAAERVRQLGPRSIARSVLGRLGLLWPEALSLARAVAVLGTECELRHAGALAELDDRQVVAAADALTEAQVLAPGRPLRFIHPVVRQAVYEDQPASRRAADHARAARLLDAEGAAAERVALHLLASEPAASEWVTERLRTAAAGALQSGSPAAAVALLERALTEPPAPGDRHALLLELGTAGLAAGDRRCVDWFERAADAAPDPNTKAVANFSMGNAALLLSADIERVAGVFQRRPIGVAPEIALLIEAGVESVIAQYVDGGALARARGWKRETTTPPSGETPGERVWLAQAVLTAVMEGAPAERTIALAERALASGTLLAESGEQVQYALAAYGLLFCWRLPRALELFERGIADARQRGSPLMIDMYLVGRADTQLRSGRLRDAEVDVREALELGVWGEGTLYKLALLVDVLREYGDLEQAQQALAERGFDSGPPPQRTIFGILMLEARGRLRLAEGHPERALADFVLCADWLSKMGFRDAALLPWRPGAALAHHALGAEAEERALAAEQVELARTFGAPPALAEALRIRASVEAESSARIDHLRNALRVVEGAGAPLEQAKTLVNLGAALRRARQRGEARPLLEQGMELAHRCHATALTEWAREELLVLGARPRRFAVTGVDSLTASELRVAEMAASGMTNREIAQALFVTQRTVEVHLSHSYQKLDIGSRRELKDALAAEVSGV